MHFTIPSDEGLPIRGEFDVPSAPRALVVVVHGFKGFKDWGFFPYLAESLCEAHFVACRFNMSRSGIGENPETFERLDLFAEDTYSRQLADLRAVVAHAHETFPFLPIFLVGHSRGGGVALLGAAGVPHLRGIVTLSAIANVDRWDDATKARWRADGFIDVINSRTGQNMRMTTAILEDYEADPARFDILAAAGRLRCPLLVLHGERDESVPVEESALIAKRASDATRVVIASASHTYNAIHPLIHVPFPLAMAVTLTTKFVTAYSETRTIVGI